MPFYRLQPLRIPLNLTNGERNLITIRPFEMKDEDYQLAADIGNAVWTEYPETLQELKESDEKQSKAVKWGRYFAELDGQTVGFAYYSQSLWINHPGKLAVDVMALPGYRNRGVGTALWQHLCREVEQFDPLRLRTVTREDYEDGVRFAQKFGFTEKMRDWESRLDPATLNLAEWKRYPRRIAEQGIEIKTVVELASDPNRDRKLYELGWAVDRDVPSTEPPSKLPFEEFQKVWERTNLVPDAWFVALHNGRQTEVNRICPTAGDSRNPHLERNQKRGDSGYQQPHGFRASTGPHRLYQGDAGGTPGGRPPHNRASV